MDSPPTVDVRRLVPDDWEAYRALRLQALADAPDAFAVQFVEVEHLPEEHWRARLGGPVFLAYEDGAPVAMGGGWAHDDGERYFVWGMWTAPAARGHGHARRLLHTVTAAPEAAGRDVYLHVTVGNAIAHRLYLESGFEPTGEDEPLREGSPLTIELLRYAR